MHTLWQDVRYAVRSLRKDVAFSVIAILTLALGIGANTAIFGLVNTVLLRPLPYKNAERLVMVWGYNRARGFTTDLVSPLDYRDWKSQNHVFENMGASTDVTYTLTGAGEPSLLIGYSFSADFFDVLGVRPLIGRTFVAEEEQPGKNRVTVLSYSLWQTRFGTNPDVLGKSVTLDGEPYTVIGVMPQGFEYPTHTELWTPYTVLPEAANDRAYRYLRIMGRLKPGVSTEQAQSEMNAIARRLAVEYPKTNKDEGATNVISLRQQIAGDVRPALLVLLGAVGFVLLIACANVANLLLARSAGREKEIAVRTALGAGRSRLVRQFLTESFILGLAGGGLGLLLASWCTNALLGMFPSTIFNLDIPHLDRIAFDSRVYGFTLAISVLTSVAFGLVPAIQLPGSPNDVLKESGRGLVLGSPRRNFRNALVIVEIAVSLLLLAAAGVTLRTFVNLVSGDLGFRTDHVLTMRVLPPGSKYKNGVQQVALNDGILEHIQGIPGVQAAGTITFLPLSGWEGQRSVALASEAVPEDQRPMVQWSSVSPDYFRAMNIPLLQGRELSQQDRQGAQHVAVVSKGLASQLTPNGDVIGQRLSVEGIQGTVEIVGVVGDVRHFGMTVEAKSELYLSYSQFPEPILCFAIRATGDPQAVTKSAEDAVWAVDKDQAVAFVMPLEQLAGESLAPQRMIMLILGVFGTVALLMAAFGIYGVIASTVARRTQEFGIRVALGARAIDVLGLVLRHSLILVLIGIGFGLVGAFGLMRFLGSLLYGVRPLDPATLAIVAVAMAGVALLASYIPARRATRVDPMVALRYE